MIRHRTWIQEQPRVWAAGLSSQVVRGATQISAISVQRGSTWMANSANGVQTYRVALFALMIEDVKSVKLVTSQTRSSASCVRKRCSVAESALTLRLALSVQMTSCMCRPRLKGVSVTPLIW